METFKNQGMGLLIGLCFTVVITGCQGSYLSYKNSNPAVVNLDLASTSEQGKALYQQKCSSCHGALESSAKLGATAGQISQAIANIPSMSIYRNVLTTEQVAWIAAALKPEVPQCQSAPDPGRESAHRLNNVEYDNALRDLLGITTKYSIAMSFPTDDYADNFNNNAKILGLTANHISNYLNAAEAAINETFGNPGLKAKIFACDLNQAACLQNTLTGFLLKAFRRPATAGELNAYINIARGSLTQGDSIEEGLKVALQGALISPHFLIRTIAMAKPNDPSYIANISSYELASRLSFFIWSSIPDTELLNAAANGSLLQSDVLAAQTRRMLKDGKSAALVENFAMQWMRLRRLNDSKPDASIFPGFSDQLKADMTVETKMFFQDLFARDGNFFELLSSQYSFVNNRLAAHYGLNGVSSVTFVKTSLAGAERTGIITQGSLLTMNAATDHTSIVRRGKWVLDNLLCSPPAPPPPDTATVLPVPSTSQTVREQFERHRSQASCMGCHSKIDPIGFALENFNAVGQFRTLDNGLPIDNSGELPDGTKFNGAKEMAKVISDDYRFKTCVSEKFFGYALGRLPEEADRCTINRLGLQFVSPNQSVSQFIISLVQSDPFRKQRGEGVK